MIASRRLATCSGVGAAAGGHGFSDGPKVGEGSAPMTGPAPARAAKWHPRGVDLRAAGAQARADKLKIITRAVGDVVVVFLSQPLMAELETEMLGARGQPGVADDDAYGDEAAAGRPASRTVMRLSVSMSTMS